jgi:phospholipid/cholesterol/gamma-HCH transport system substrate-binding protein
MSTIASRRFLLGLLLIALVIATAGMAYASYRGTFSKYLDVTVNSDRAGLTLATGARVKLRGVDVGRVASVRPAANGASIGVEIFAEQANAIPSNVTAQIVPPTAFGAKYIQLTSNQPTSSSLRAGSQLKATSVTTEFNEGFENLTRVLDAARPSEVNSALTAGAELLDGRGDDLGRLVTESETYLREFNTVLPAVQHDLALGADVLDTYDRLAPDLIDLTRDITPLSKTLASHDDELADLMGQSSNFSAQTRRILDRNRQAIYALLQLFDPVTRAVARYAPQFPCWLGGLAETTPMAERAIGGDRPGLSAYTRFRPSDEPWKYPDNLPILGEDRGPACYGLPTVTQREAERPMPDFDVGANPDHAPQSPADELSTTFFGALAGLVPHS